MTSFRTELIGKPSPFLLSYSDKLLTIGSCFADQIGSRLSNAKFTCTVNPSGTVYNPLSIHRILLWSLGKASFSEKHVVQHQGIWSHLDFHSRWNSLDQETLLKELEKLNSAMNLNLTEASTLMITYGTAWSYRYLETGQLIANCHKLPQQKFLKMLLSVQEITQSFDELLAALLHMNPTLKIILTISPVRHLKDTLELNQVSKATLRLACHELTERYQQVYYFPAYEFMMDDLRDYRFYEKDMIHPNEIAIDYLWEKFSHTFFSTETRQYLKQYQEIKSALIHRPYHPEGEAHQKFLNSLLSKAVTLSQHLPLDEEIQTIQSQLISRS